MKRIKRKNFLNGFKHKGEKHHLNAGHVLVGASSSAATSDKCKYSSFHFSILSTGKTDIYRMRLVFNHFAKPHSALSI